MTLTGDARQATLRGRPARGSLRVGMSCQLEHEVGRFVTDGRGRAAGGAGPMPVRAATPRMVGAQVMSRTRIGWGIQHNKLALTVIATPVSTRPAKCPL